LTPFCTNSSFDQLEFEGTLSQIAFCRPSEWTGKGGITFVSCTTIFINGWVEKVLKVENIRLNQSKPLTFNDKMLLAVFGF
jgi:hypothetical protein